VGDKGHKGRVVYWLPTLPAQHHRLFAVVKAGGRNTSKMGKCILVAPDERKKFAIKGKIDVLPTRKTENL
jgi:hypothetical protein